MEKPDSNNIFSAYYGNKNSDILILWLHGWGQSHKSLLPLATFFSKYCNILIDFPGFGQSKTPSSPYNISDYAKILEIFINNKNKKIFIIGHSFGCRVGIKYCQKYQNKISGLVLISAAGIKRKRSAKFKIKSILLKNCSKTIKIIDKIFKSNLKDKFANNFGSSDYRNCKGIMRDIFVKIINEDLTNCASNINNQTLIINGDKDSETPIETAQKFNKLITNSKLIIMNNFDHYNILTLGRFQLQNFIDNFIKNNI